MNTKHFLALIAAMAALASGAKADIISTGALTFADQSTGLTWIKVDTFWGLSYNEIAAGLTGSGFTFATFSQVQTLFADAGNPATEPEYDSLAAAMGGAWSGGTEPTGREIIWGDYLSDSSGENWAWSFSPNSGGGAWASANEGYPLDFTYADLGAWVVQAGAASIPDHASSWLLLGLSAVGLLACRQRFGRAITP